LTSLTKNAAVRYAIRLTRRLERAYAVASRRATASPNVAVRSPVGPDDVTAAELFNHSLARSCVIIRDAFLNKKSER